MMQGPALRSPRSARLTISVSHHGFVTLPSIGQEGARAGLGSGRNGRSLPVRHRFGSELSQGRAGDEVALEVEGVVDGSVDAEKALCGASRFEALHFPLPPSHGFCRGSLGEREDKLATEVHRSPPHVGEP